MHTLTGDAMATLVLNFDGGSLMRPDSAAIITPNGTEVVTFSAMCFDENGEWRPEVVAALREAVSNEVTR